MDSLLDLPVPTLRDVNAVGAYKPGTLGRKRMDTIDVEVFMKSLKELARQIADLDSKYEELLQDFRPRQVAERCCPLKSARKRGLVPKCRGQVKDSCR
jgi:hypothetical protein